MIRCPHCKSARLRVIGSADKAKDGSHNFYRRHRKCRSCGRNFHTREYVEGSHPIDESDVRDMLAHLLSVAQLLRKRKPR